MTEIKEGSTHPGGRPTKYQDSFNKTVYKLSLLGLTDKEMADVLGIAESTFYLWMIEHEKFSEAVKAGKEIADAEVAEALYQRAKGYSHKETDVKVVEGKIVRTQITKHYPPDTAAAIIWLKNRRRQNWRDKQPDDDAAPVIIAVSVTPEEAKTIADSIKQDI